MKAHSRLELRMAERAMIFHQAVEHLHRSAHNSMAHPNHSNQPGARRPAFSQTMAHTQAQTESHH